MEFTVNCPIDGSIEVGLEDIDTVVLRESERADITFVCPHCGSRVSVSAIVPAFLLSAIEALAEDSGESGRQGFVVIGAMTGTPADDAAPSGADPEMGHADAYCEYFRRQLEGVTSVDDVLAEIDSKSTSI